MSDPDIPVLYVYSQSDEPNAFCLVPDDEGGAALAAEHLVALGRKRIAHITGPERFEAVRLRRERISQGARARRPRGARGLLSLRASGRRNGAARRSHKLFAHRTDAPDAIFCGNDQIARGVADALRERGIAVPDAVSIVGFDNWEIVAAATRPPLTIDRHEPEGARPRGRPQADRSDRRQVHLSGVQRLPCSLVVRESCGASRCRQVEPKP